MWAMVRWLLLLLWALLGGAWAAGGAAGAKVLVWWHAPFLSAGGYASEAVAFAQGMDAGGGAELAALWLTPHGDAADPKVLEGLPQATADLLRRRIVPPHVTMRELDRAVRESGAGAVVVVCHSEPGAWHKARYQTTPCPPFGYRRRTAAGVPFAYVGRSMFETDGLDPDHRERLLRMDRLWVPTDWQRNVYAENGIPDAAVDVIGEPVDVDFYAPGGKKFTNAELRRLGKRLRLDGSAARDDDDDDAHSAVFLAVGKWESRKGFDVLVRAYAAAFCNSRARPPLLVLKLSGYHGDVNAALPALVAAANATCPGSLYVITDHIATTDMPALFRSATALVQPSRGEGWGRPHAEAMACGTPVIATDWSGPQAFVDDSVGWLLRNEGLKPVEEADPSHHWAFKGHRWATPSEAHLAALLASVAAAPSSAALLGASSRSRARASFAPRRLAAQAVRLASVAAHAAARDHPPDARADL